MCQLSIPSSSSRATPHGLQEALTGSRSTRAETGASIFDADKRASNLDRNQYWAESRFPATPAFARGNRVRDFSAQRPQVDLRLDSRGTRRPLCPGLCEWTFQAVFHCVESSEPGRRGQAVFLLERSRDCTECVPAQVRTECAGLAAAQINSNPEPVLLPPYRHVRSRARDGFSSASREAMNLLFPLVNPCFPQSKSRLSRRDSAVSSPRRDRSGKCHTCKWRNANGRLDGLESLV